METTLRRREFLAMMTTAAVTSATSGWAIAAGRQAAAAGARLIDTHHHFAAPGWVRRMAESKRQGWDTFQTYSRAQSLEAMDRAGIQTAMLSTTTPGVWFGDNFAAERAAAIALAREVNEYGARQVADTRGRYGLFAVLPLPDIDASLREVEYAFDTLEADGVGLLTSYGDIWLGDVRLQPVFDELSRRRAIVYVHPTDAACCHALLPNTPPATVEWNTDTGRSIYSVLAEGIQGRGAPSAASRYANVTFIWSHAGGTLLGLVGRFGLGDPDTLANPPASSRLAQLRKFYFDTAGSANPVTMQGLKTLVGPSQILYGTDFPFGGTDGPAAIVRNLQRCGFTATELTGVERENALRLVPKYRS
jgi:6-methylsalicylate decarboxylase